ncbi:hypothetical protein KIW84_010051 [Lathyrus oleraceus]|uniref:Uncharacterized protein n=1 Tax=Pisum sativum TaxID=3888 RepID=A0A9D5B992_PEA|nr:hypothetical protein KIW84_010051 [Pisum sativum]
MLENFEAGQSGWCYYGCSECTISVALKDGKLRCFANHETDEPVPRYKLEVLGVDGKFRARFLFWDNNCVKLIEKSALELKRQLIKKELAIRVVFQPKYGSLSVVRFRDNEESCKKIKENLKS